MYLQYVTIRSDTFSKWCVGTCTPVARKRTLSIDTTIRETGFFYLVRLEVILKRHGAIRAPPNDKTVTFKNKKKKNKEVRSLVKRPRVGSTPRHTD
jgi:hypothetical protein